MAKRVGQIAGRARLRVAGLMSGTSADGVDVAIADIDRRGVRLLAFDTFAYPRVVQEQVFRAFDGGSAGVGDISDLNFRLGAVFAEVLKRLGRRASVPMSSIDLIGSHGQTVYHNPQGRVWAGRRVRSTLQVGEPSVIAQETGITTVADFRPRDMAAGGEGAPLVPYADYVLFRHRRRNRAIQNIGGIANVTWLPGGGDLADVIAFDTGPGNMMIDRAVQLMTGGKRHFDRAGKVAARGRVDRGLLQRLFEHSFLRRRPPKSTGREEFGWQFCDDVYRRALDKGTAAVDVVATLTALTAVSIAQAYGRFLPALPDEVVLCGGGARNGTLVGMLAEQLPGVPVVVSDDLGIDSDAREALAFAVLAYATIKGMCSNVCGATGAEEPVILGKIIPA